MTSVTQPSLRISVAANAGVSTLERDVRDGLTKPFKELPPKHLYDELGSRLFEEICAVPEYYPTRTERLILQTHASEIAERTHASELVELGAGTAAKTRVLLDALSARSTLEAYVAFDIEETVVRETVASLAGEYPEMSAIHGVVGDFERDLELIPRPTGEPRIVALLGGTIGNFATESRRYLLADIAGLLGPNDHLLLGADLVKDPAVIEAAYDDSAGVTAAFNRNVLTIINRELDANFDVDQFQHRAFFDRQQEWIEMRLRAQALQPVRIGALDLDVTFDEGEEIRTEISAKFTPQRLEDDLASAGLALTELMTDPDDLFGLALAKRDTKS